LKSVASDSPKFGGQAARFKSFKKSDLCGDIRSFLAKPKKDGNTNLLHLAYSKRRYRFEVPEDFKQCH
jgi:hypothetical protein